ASRCAAKYAASGGRLKVCEGYWILFFWQGQEQSVNGLGRGLVGGGDGQARHAAVEGMAALEAELGGGGVCEDGAGDVLQHAAVEEGGEGGVEEDGEGGGSLLEEEAIGEVFGGS